MCIRVCTPLQYIICICIGENISQSNLHRTLYSYVKLGEGLVLTAVHVCVRARVFSHSRQSFSEFSLACGCGIWVCVYIL